MAYDKVVDSSVLDAGLKLIADAIREKAGTTDALTFPQAMADAIAGIAAGATVETGTVTFNEETQNYKFVEGNPDIFICYVDPLIAGDKEHSSAKYVWCFIQDTRVIKSNPTRYHSCYIGYNNGSRKYYAYYSGKSSEKGSFNNGDFNSLFGAVTYRWFAIWGVTEQ